MTWWVPGGLVPDHQPAEHQEGEVEITQVPPTLPGRAKQK